MKKFTSLLSFSWRSQGLSHTSTLPLYQRMVILARLMALNTIFKLTTTIWISLVQIASCTLNQSIQISICLENVSNLTCPKLNFGSLGHHKTCLFSESTLSQIILTLYFKMLPNPRIIVTPHLFLYHTFNPLANPISPLSYCKEADHFSSSLLLLLWSKPTLSLIWVIKIA